MNHEQEVMASNFVTIFANSCKVHLVKTLSISVKCYGTQLQDDTRPPSYKPRLLAPAANRRIKPILLPQPGHHEAPPPPRHGRRVPRRRPRPPKSSQRGRPPAPPPQRHRPKHSDTQRDVQPSSGGDGVRRRGGNGHDVRSAWGRVSLLPQRVAVPQLQVWRLVSLFAKYEVHIMCAVPIQQIVH